MTKRAFRRNIASMGYRLHKHNGLFNLIDIAGNYLIADGLTLEQAAEHIALLEGFPVVD